MPVSSAIDRVQKQGGQAAYLVLGADLKAGHHACSFDFDEQILDKGLQLLASLFEQHLALEANDPMNIWLLMEIQHVDLRRARPGLCWVRLVSIRPLNVQ